MLKPGTILDERYEIVDVVGAGGMSTVYRAKDHRLNRFVAVKVLKTEYAGDAGFVSKFKVEAQASAGLTHPNIVSVYDVSEDNGRYFIVMELVEGITLKEYISLNGRLSMDQAIDFSIQIASGLESAHEHHVIHRDIKPQNIIVAKNGNLKVTDFGIAKAATSNTMSTAGMGSVHYISPEQARGGYSDERSDIYSLGITMYEMVTGRVPFEGDTNVAIALMHIQNEIVPPREYYPDIYSSFEKVILKATQKKPERRYLTAAALIADLKRVKNNPNIDIIVAPATVPNSPTREFSEQDRKQITNEVRNSDRQGNAGQAERDGYNSGRQETDRYGASDRYESDRYESDRYDSGRYESDRYDSGRYEADRYDSGRYDSGRSASGRYDSGRAGGERITSEPKPDRERLDRLIYDDDDEDGYYDDDEAQSSSRQPARKQASRGKGVKVVDDDGYYDEDYRPKKKKSEDDEEVDPKLAKAVMIGGVVAAVVVAVIILIIVGNVMGWFKFGKTSTTTEEVPVPQSTTTVSGSTATEKQTTEEQQEKVLEMPNVVGLTQLAAEKSLKERGFTNFRFEEVYDEKTPKSYVSAQSIKEKEKVGESTEVVVTVSLGAEELEVPDVYGYTDEQATKVMQEAGFKVQHAFEYNDTVEKDKIIKTTPERNEKAAKGSKVILVTSNGAEVKTVKVPKVIGISESAAGSSLEAVKLSLGNVSYEHSSVESGVVIRQSVAEDSVVNEGTKVDIVVSQGPLVVTYTGSVAGSISASDVDYITDGKKVHVTAYITDGSGSYEVASVDVAPEDKSNISLSGKVTGLKASDGTVTISVKDQEGTDVTAYYLNSLTLTFTPE